MEEEEALQLLQNSSGLTPQQLRSSEAEEMKKIISELGCFALAIQLTGSYISQTPRLLTDLSRYLPEYRKRRKQLLENTPGLADQYEMSVLSSWEVSFGSLRRVSIIAASLLSILSFIDSTDVSESWFETFFIFMHWDQSEILSDELEERLRHCQKVICPEGFTYYDLEQGFKPLTAFSFIQQMPTGSGYSVHKLVHAWGYDRLEHQRRLDLIRVTVMFIFCQMTVRSALYVEQRRVAKRAMATFDVISSMGLSNMELQAYRHSVCICLREHFVPFFDRIEDWSNKYKIQLFILNCIRGFCGRDHPDSLFYMQSIVVTLYQQGKYQEAVALLEEVVEASARLPPTNLCEYLEAMDRWAIIMKTAVEEKVRLCGEGRLSRTSSDKNLDFLDPKCNGPMRKIPHGLMETNLDSIDTHERNFGAEDPRTLMAGDQLAFVLKTQGFLESAQTVLEGIVCCPGGTTDGALDLSMDKVTRSLVPLGSLAIIRGMRGDLKGGEAVLRLLLYVQKRLCGLEHSNTMTTFMNLIQHLDLQGKRDEMVKMKDEAVKGMTPAKPETLKMLHKLSFFLMKQKATSEAEEFLREMLETYTRTLGAGHPSMLCVSESLDCVAETAETQRRKEKLIKQLEESKQLLGANANHPLMLEISTKIMTAVTRMDEELNDRFRLSSVPEEDVEERRWND